MADRRGSGKVTNLLGALFHNRRTPYSCHRGQDVDVMS